MTDNTVILPSHLKSLSITNGNKFITLSLEYINTDYLSGVQINYKTESYPISPTDGESVIITSPETSIDISGLINKTTYYFRIFLFNQIGDSKYYQTDITNAQITGTPRDVEISGINVFEQGDDYIVIRESGTFTLTAPAGTRFYLASGGQGGYGGQGGQGGAGSGKPGSIKITETGGNVGYVGGTTSITMNDTVIKSNDSGYSYSIINTNAGLIGGGGDGGTGGKGGDSKDAETSAGDGGDGGKGGYMTGSGGNGGTGGKGVITYSSSGYHWYDYGRGGRGGANGNSNTKGAYGTSVPSGSSKYSSDIPSQGGDGGAGAAGTPHGLYAYGGNGGVGGQGGISDYSPDGYSGSKGGNGGGGGKGGLILQHTLTESLQNVTCVLVVGSGGAGGSGTAGTYGGVYDDNNNRVESSNGLAGSSGLNGDAGVFIIEWDN